MVMKMEVAKGKSKKDLEKEDLKLNGATKEDIFYQLPYTLTIGEEKFEIKRKSVMKSFPIQRKIDSIIQSILYTVGKEKINSLVKEKENFSLESLIPLLAENYSMFSEQIDSILEIFIDNFIEEEDKERLENVTIEDFDKAFNDIRKIIFPFIIRPVKRIMFINQ